MKIKNIAINKVQSLSDRDSAYYTKSTIFKNFLNYDFDYNEFPKVIAQRKEFGIDRQLLKTVIKAQYEDIICSSKTQNHIDSIDQDNCFTITTAHQPSLFTGPLYYVYKILSTINLCNQLQTDFPDNHFVPVFVIGGEDHDFDEINHFHIYNKKIEWHNAQQGAVGRMDTNGLMDVFNELVKILGEKSKVNNLLSSIKEVINNASFYGEFSFKLTHLLFDKFGLVILRMDDRKLKKAFTPIIKEEIFNQPSQSLVEATQSEIENIGFKKQAYARKINFFYLTENGRHRIEQTEDRFSILDTDRSLSKSEMMVEIENHPEKFSPNVITRPLFQELILPNLAYIGGGGELAYWMERKTQFNHFGLPFPMLIRRNSGLIISEQQVQQINKLGFKLDDIFEDENELIKIYISQSDNPDINLNESKSELENIFKKIENLSKTIDSTLIKTVQSECAKSLKSISYIESKLTKSVKQKEQVQINRIKKLKLKLFPQGLQERHDNIFEFISKYGEDIIADMLPQMNPFDKDFKVFII
ncbi:MAG: bacillithiol biosynthesis cysteine-adding enzyme BshC [Bacteroidia bacterium]|nr:bacillithiol biosynthesis cysteine-adding enzyme BshC [Bacteroidia bacterium]